MLSVALLALSSLSMGQQGLATFTDRDLGLSFQHPKAWVVGKKDKFSTTIMIPLQGTTRQAELVVNVTGFSAPPDLWQTIQLRANEQLQHKVLRQWTQEILGAPLLLTKVEIANDIQPGLRLTGLLYAKANRKLLFRLTAPREQYDQAEYDFLNVLESLRTLDGTALEPEDPSRTPIKETKRTPKAPREQPKPEPSKRITKIDDQAKGSAKQKAPVVGDLMLGETKVRIGYTNGWTFKALPERQFELENSGLGVTLKGEVRAVAAEEAANQALLRRAGLNLAKLDGVKNRSERPMSANKAGFLASSIFREGTSAAGNLQTLDAVVTSLDLYLLLTWSGNVQDSSRLQVAINELLDLMSLERG
ncbi:MAG: hypothetical protein ACOYON_03355 [Fimbriimonas sp.]